MLDLDQTPDTPNIESPPAAYRHRLTLNRERLAHEQKWHWGLGYAKLVLGLIEVGFFFWFLHVLHSGWVLLMPVAAFVVLAIAHNKVLERIEEIESLVTYHERGLARLEDRWAGTGESGERFLDSSHPYARDLDLFGAGSIFELLCTFRTRAGEDTLARWLLEPATADEIRARQAAAQDPRMRLEFRESLFTAGNKVRPGLHPDRLVAWAESVSPSTPPWLPVLAVSLAVLWVVSLAYGIMRGSYWPLLLLSAINLALNRYLMKQLSTSAAEVEEASEDLDLLVRILRILEQQAFESPRLVHLQSTLRSGGVAPSGAVSRLNRIAQHLAQRRNLFLQMFGVTTFLFYTALVMFRAQSWHREFGSSIRGWLATVGEMEVLAAFSGYAYEHPGDAWPEIDDDKPCFEAESFAHPLLPESNAQRNDLKLGDGLQLIVISGPNMSGKSTFVRGVGVNAILALSGAPVRAKRMRLSRLAVGASICILDSLQGGVSRFYAEIKRLKLISDLAQGPIPVLFLLDELLSGTNSHDRLLGTQLVVGALVQRGAMGMVTTHDLALAEIPEGMNGKALNCHFEDHIENGRLAFDFKLRPGVVETSNALKLMQSIGLLNN